MKKTAVDYSKLRLRNLHTPPYRHILLLLGWVFYLLAYYLTEKWIPEEVCHVIHTPLDDRIPFCEGFAVFYVGWYLLIVGSLLYFLLYSPESFKNLQTYFIIVQILSVSIHILYPSRQTLRPEVFPRQNLLTEIMAWIYRVDTPTGVLPSLHVACAVGIASVWLREQGAKPWLKASVTGFCLGVCASVLFVKQHSVLDVLAAIPVCLVAHWFVFCRKEKICPNQTAAADARLR